jgi:hypothetical protein
VTAGEAEPVMPVHDGALLLAGRVAHAHHQHEAVDLRLGQRVGALLLDRVLRRHHDEGLGQLEGRVADGDLRSCIASSSALCTLAGARLISSASTRFAKTGPALGR